MEKDILIVIDYQVDFVSGALANPAAETLEAGIEARVREYRQADKPVIFTKDTHLEEYLNTREGKFLPVPHCVRGTEGWGLYGSLSDYEEHVQDGVMIVEMCIRDSSWGRRTGCSSAWIQTPARSICRSA